MQPNVCISLKSLLDWFYQVREPYFFRQNRTPYRVWISEVALQQTRISAALEPLQRFFTHFPDVQALAQASEQEVLYAFRGLGYYNRARNLKKAAEYLIQNHQGILPADYEELLKIPTIGPYTGAAIASICFGIYKPVVDGNIKRILARMHTWSESFASRSLETLCYTTLENCFKAMTFPPGDVNEALMELGQKLCLRTSPHCSECPMLPWCKAAQNNLVEKFPKIEKKVKTTPVIWNLFIFYDMSQQKILLQHWPNFYFLKGHISFPSILFFPKEKKYLFSFQKKDICIFFPEKTKYLDIISLNSDTDLDFFTLAQQTNFLEKKLSTIGQPLPILHHHITHHKIKIQPWVCLQKVSAKNKNFFSCKIHQIDKKLVCSALLKIWKIFLKNF